MLEHHALHWLIVKRRPRQANSLYVCLDDEVKKRQHTLVSEVADLNEYYHNYERLRSLWHNISNDHTPRLLSLVVKCREELETDGIPAPILPALPPDQQQQPHTEDMMHNVCYLVHKCLVRQYMRGMSHLSYLTSNSKYDADDDDDDRQQADTDNQPPVTGKAQVPHLLLRHNLCLIIQRSYTYIIIE